MKTARSNAQPSLLKQLNERHVLGAIQANGPLSRADITRHTGISGPTVTRAVSSLIEAQLLEEHDSQQSGVGRPGKLLRLASRYVSVLGAVLGSEECEIVSAGLDGNVEADHVRRFATPSKYPKLVDELVAQAQELVGQRPNAVLALGLSVPGLLNRRAGRSIVSPNLHQIDGQSLGADLRERLQVETVVLQECHALCLAEQAYGDGRGIQDFAMLDISEGLGLGVMHGGRLVQGHSGLAGELGHVTVDLQGKPCGCGNRGCLETVATDVAFASAINERLGRRLSLDEIIARIHAGELNAEPEIRHVLGYLAVAVAAVINIFNPHKLFIYGRFLDAEPGLFDQLLELTAARALRPSLADCQIIRARGNKRLGAVAGAIRSLTGGWDEQAS